jgi:regulatory factor X 1/2/3
MWASSRVFRRLYYLFNQNLVEVLIPDVPRQITSLLTRSISNFSNGLKQWLTGAMANFPEEIKPIKVSWRRFYGATSY